MEEQKEVAKKVKILSIIAVLLVLLSEIALAWQLHTASTEVVNLTLKEIEMQNKLDRLEHTIKGLIMENGNLKRKYGISEKMLALKDKALQELQEKLDISESDFLKIKDSIKDIFEVCKMNGILSFNGEEFLCTDREGLNALIEKIIDSAEPVDVHPQTDA